MSIKNKNKLLLDEKSIYLFIQSYYNNPKTPYELFINRITNNNSNNLSTSDRNKINYFTLENLIISNLLFVEIITRPISKLNKNFSYWIEIDKDKREYVLFTSDTNNKEFNISPYIGKDKNILDLLSKKRKITYNNTELRKLMKNDYLSLINKNFIYQDMNVYDSLEFIHSIKNSLPYDTYIGFIDRINTYSNDINNEDEDEGNNDNSNNNVIYNIDEYTISNSNGNFNMRIDSPNRIFSCVMGVDDIQCKSIIKEILNKEDKNVMYMYSKYVYYLYHSIIPIDAYYRLGLYENPYDIINYDNIVRLNSSWISNHPIYNVNKLYNQNFILKKQVFDNIAPYYYFGENRNQFYGVNTKNIVYTLPPIENIYHKTTIYKNNQSKNPYKEPIYTKDKDNQCYLLFIKYDRFYINELYYNRFKIYFKDNELFNYEIDKVEFVGINYTSIDNINDITNDITTNKKNPNYYENILRNKKIENYTKESILNKEFDFTSSDEDNNISTILDPIPTLGSISTTTNSNKVINKIKFDDDDDDDDDDNNNNDNDDIHLLLSIMDKEEEKNENEYDEEEYYSKNKFNLKMELIEDKIKEKYDIEQIEELKKDYEESLLLFNNSNNEDENNEDDTITTSNVTSKNTTNSIIEILSSQEEEKKFKNDLSTVTNNSNNNSNDNTDDTDDSIIFISEKRFFTTTSNTSNKNNKNNTNINIELIDSNPLKRRKLNNKKKKNLSPPKTTDWINWKRKK